MNFCPNCGTALSEGQLPCPQCGFPDGSEARSQQFPSKKRHHSLVLKIILPVAALLVCVAGFFLLRILFTPDFVREAEQILRERQPAFTENSGLEFKSCHYLATYWVDDDLIVLFFINPDRDEDNVLGVRFQANSEIRPCYLYSLPRRELQAISRGQKNSEFSEENFYHGRNLFTP